MNLISNFRISIWPKLKREWKTAALAVADLLIEVEYQLSSYLDIAPFIPSEWRPVIHIVFPMLMLLLRRWRDA